MPTRKEAEEYKKRIEGILKMLANWETNSPTKSKLIDEYLEKWKRAYEALLGLGIPLDEDED